MLLLRESRRLSLRTLADKVDLSASFLSQIERDEASPSISSLEKIASALEVDVSTLFLKSQPEPLLRSKDQVIERVEAGVVRQLSRMSAAIRPNLLSLEGGSQFVSLPRHNEVFFYILSGVLYVTYNGSESMLETGDSFHLTLQTPLLTLENRGSESTAVLSINYFSRS